MSLGDQDITESERQAAEGAMRMRTETPDPNHDAKIDSVVTVISELITLGGLFYPPLRFARPLIMAFIHSEAVKLKIGLSNGTIVPDGEGGFVPSTNSRYDPKTGQFL